MARKRNQVIYSSERGGETKNPSCREREKFSRWSVSSSRARWALKYAIVLRGGLPEIPFQEEILLKKEPTVQNKELPEQEKQGFRFRVFDGSRVKTVMVAQNHNEDITFVKIGKSDECQIRLDSKFISQIHAEIIIEDSEQIIIEPKSEFPVYISSVPDGSSDNVGVYKEKGPVIFDRPIKPGEAIIVGTQMIFLTHINGDSFGDYPDDDHINRYLSLITPSLIIGESTHVEPSGDLGEGAELDLPDLPSLYDSKDDISEEHHDRLSVNLEDMGSPQEATPSYTLDLSFDDPGGQSSETDITRQETIPEEYLKREEHSSSSSVLSDVTSDLGGLKGSDLTWDDHSGDLEEGSSIFGFQFSPESKGSCRTAEYPESYGYQIHSEIMPPPSSEMEEEARTVFDPEFDISFDPEFVEMESDDALGITAERPSECPMPPPSRPSEYFFDEEQANSETSLPPSPQVYEAVVLFQDGLKKQVVSLRSDSCSLSLPPLAEGDESSMVILDDHGILSMHERFPDSTKYTVRPLEIGSEISYDSRRLVVCSISRPGSRFDTCDFHTASPVIFSRADKSMKNSTFLSSLERIEKEISQISGPTQYAKKCWINRMCSEVDRMNGSFMDEQNNLLESMECLVRRAIASGDPNRFFEHIEGNRAFLELSSFSNALESGLVHVTPTKENLSRAREAMANNNEARMDFLYALAEPFHRKDLSRNYEDELASMSTYLIKNGIAAWMHGSEVIIGEVSSYCEANGSIWAFTSKLQNARYGRWMSRKGYYEQISGSKKIVFLGGGGAFGKKAHFYKLHKYISEKSGFDRAIREKYFQEADRIEEAVSLAVALHYGSDNRKWQALLTKLSKTSDSRIIDSVELLKRVIERGSEVRELALLNFIQLTYLDYLGVRFTDLISPQAFNQGFGDSDNPILAGLLNHLLGKSEQDIV